MVLTQNTFLFTVAALMAAVVVAGPAGAKPTPGQSCEAQVDEASGSFAKCRLRAQASFVKRGDSGQLSVAVGKCMDSFANAYAKAFAKYDGSCPTIESQSNFDTYLTQCMGEVAAAAAGGSLPQCGDGLVNVAGEQCDGADFGGESCSSLGFQSGAIVCDGTCKLDTAACSPASFPATGQTTCWDGGGTPISCAATGHDGEVQAGGALTYVDSGETITDINTGLTWEKLSDDLSIHDWNVFYTWDGAHSGKIAMLNSMAAGGYSDWRLPNVKELQSLIHFGAANPAVASMFHAGCVVGCSLPACSCTQSNYYWASSSSFETPSQAWLVHFGNGGVLAGDKSLDFAVRAVRGGL